MNSLLLLESFISHSGKKLDFKIECDFLTDADLNVFAHIILKKYNFSNVIGIPRGGVRLSNLLKHHQNSESKHILIVDDVLTTGDSMEKMRSKFIDKSNIKGVVMFSRGKTPNWIDPIFQLWKE